MQRPGEPVSYNGSGMFNNLSRNKKSITANLHHPKGLEAVERLIAASDIVVENFSAGVLERLGLGWQRQQELNPGIIYVSLSGFGHLGRDAAYVTWGPTAQAASGVTAMSGLPDQPPAGWGYSYLDHSAGYYGAVGALMALYARERGGVGQHVDIAQVETGMVLTGVPVLDYQVNGRHYERAGNRSRYPALAPHGIYRCRGDDRWIAIVAETEEHWEAICAVLEAGDLRADARFVSNLARVAAQDLLDEALTEHTRRFDPRELMYLLQASGVPAGVAQHQRDKMEHDPQLEARRFYRTASHPELGEHRFDGLPVRFSRSDWRIDRGAPLLGEHTHEVLTQLLGYSEDEVAEMAAELAV